MIILLYFELCQIILAQYVDTEAKECRCEEIVNKENCKDFGCFWRPKAVASQNQKIDLYFGLPKNKTAITGNQEFICTTMQCTDIKDEETCDNFDGACAWTNAGSCQLFSRCGDYSVKDPLKCYNKSTIDQACMEPADKGDDGLYTCQNDLSGGQFNFYTCYSLANQKGCESYGKANCIWSTQQFCEGYGKTCSDFSFCMALTMDACVNSNGYEKFCNLSFCVWNKVDQTCSDIKCADFTTANTCKYVQSPDKKKAQFCSWYNGACIEWNGPDETKLGRDNCMTDSLDTFTWNDQGVYCKQCHSLLLVIAYIMILMNS